MVARRPQRNYALTHSTPGDNYRYRLPSEIGEKYGNITTMIDPTLAKCQAACDRAWIGGQPCRGIFWSEHTDTGALCAVLTKVGAHVQYEALMFRVCFARFLFFLVLLNVIWLSRCDDLADTMCMCRWF
eukprot:COSAG05_NODE_3036_length_2397_cov_1.862489_1_plen_129_part_00